MAWKVSSDPARFEEAITWFIDKTPMAAGRYYSIEDAARDLGFTVSHVAQLDIVQQVLDDIAKAITNGTSLQDFSKEVSGKLEAAWGGTVANPGHRIETIYRTNIQSAFSRGRQVQMDQPEVKALRPGRLFDAVRDRGTTEVCRECDGTLVDADDPWLETHTPPLHHQCRSRIRARRKSQVERRGGYDRGPSLPRIAPNKGFGSKPANDAEVIQKLSVDRKKYDRELQEIALKKEQARAAAEKERKAKREAADKAKREAKRKAAEKARKKQIQQKRIDKKKAEDAAKKAEAARLDAEKAERERKAKEAEAERKRAEAEAAEARRKAAEKKRKDAERLARKAEDERLRKAAEEEAKRRAEAEKRVAEEKRKRDAEAKKAALAAEKKAADAARKAEKAKKIARKSKQATADAAPEYISTAEGRHAAREEFYDSMARSVSGEYGSYEVDSAQARGAVRKIIKQYLDVDSDDVSLGKRNADVYSFADIPSYAGAQHHGTHGLIEIPVSKKQQFLDSMKKSSEGIGPFKTAARQSNLKTLLHEELHGCSPVDPYAYEASFTGGKVVLRGSGLIEETTTELLAQYITTGSKRPEGYAYHKDINAFADQVASWFGLDRKGAVEKIVDAGIEFKRQKTKYRDGYLVNEAFSYILAGEDDKLQRKIAIWLHEYRSP